MSKTDLFEAIGALFRNRLPEDPPGSFILNRFLASRPELAPFAKDLSLHVRDSGMAWEVWRSLVPRSPRPPRLKYPAPTQTPAAEDLVAALVDRSHLGWTEAEDLVALAEVGGFTEDLEGAYGVD